MQLLSRASDINAGQLTHGEWPHEAASRLYTIAVRLSGLVSRDNVGPDFAFRVVHDRGGRSTCRKTEAGAHRREECRASQADHFASVRECPQRVETRTPALASQLTGKRKGPALLRAPGLSSSSARRRETYLVIVPTTPAPTVRPPSRMAKRRPWSIAIGAMSLTPSVTLSPGMTISVPSGSWTSPVTSVVRK